MRVQRDLDSAFTQGLVTRTVKANTNVFNTGKINRARSYHFRVQVYHNVDASAWVNAYPYPIKIP
jgi:hypothetical protein